MSQVVTVAARKASEAARRQRAADVMILELQAFAKTRGGRFLVFGSAADGRMSHRSDFDVVVDVPDAAEPEAVDRIEALGREHGLPVDIHIAGSTKPQFFASIEARARVLS